MSTDNSSYKDAIFQLFSTLAQFYERNGRKFPWRVKDLSTYHLLVTEILLRRTTASKVAKIWNEFFHLFPSWENLANADHDIIEKILYPLGLQKQRATQLMELAHVIALKHDEKTPTSYELLKMLPGIGEYSINAYLLLIGAFRDFPFDINVERILSRYFGRIISNTALIKKEFKSLGNHSFQIKSFYGILDLAADICKPYQPKCDDCLLSATCHFSNNPLVLKMVKEPCNECVPILSLNYQEYRNLVKDQFLRKKLRNSFKNNSVLLYVGKPLGSIIGIADLEKLDKDIHSIKVRERFTPAIRITHIRYFSKGFYPRSGVNWVYNKKMFKEIMSQIGCVRNLIEES